MTKKALWILMGILAILIGFYPAIYFLKDNLFGLLKSKPAALLTNTWWNIGFYVHILLGGLALLIGWTQFSAKLRSQYVKLHRTIGKVYVVAVLISAIAGFCIAMVASGGWIAALGFMCLALVWFYTTFTAYRRIRNKQVELHRQMMIYSYAACFGAVTLRIWLPLLMALLGDFITAYRIVAWLAWVPNLIVARQIVRRIFR
jgi:uncharacterized membrane protein